VQAQTENKISLFNSKFTVVNVRLPRMWCTLQYTQLNFELGLVIFLEGIIAQLEIAT